MGARVEPMLPGRAIDLARVPVLLEDLGFGAFVGDSAFDADRLIDEV